VKEERLLLKVLKIRCHSWIGHIITHDKFLVNILEGAIPEERLWETLTSLLQASCQKHRS
jgi:hypothetical protein